MTEAELDKRARDLWGQRSALAAKVMESYNVTDFVQTTWEKATRNNREMMRKRAIYYNEHGLPNDFAIEVPFARGKVGGRKKMRKCI